MPDEGRAENRDHAESKKDRTPNKVAAPPSEQNEREGGEQIPVTDGMTEAFSFADLQAPGRLLR